MLPILFLLLFLCLKGVKKSNSLLLIWFLVINTWLKINIVTILMLIPDNDSKMICDSEWQNGTRWGKFTFLLFLLFRFVFMNVKNKNPKYSLKISILMETRTILIRQQFSHIFFSENIHVKSWQVFGYFFQKLYVLQSKRKDMHF